MSRDAAQQKPTGPHQHLELSLLLRNIHTRRWVRLQSAIVFSEILSMADELEQLSKRYHSPELNAYSKTLRDLAEEFNQDEITNLLGEFETLIDRLA